jgi:hypothetical protein
MHCYWETAVESSEVSKRFLEYIGAVDIPYPHRSRATLGPDNNCMGDHPNEMYAGFLWPGMALEKRPRGVIPPVVGKTYRRTSQNKN